jgi:hypothetical protein
MYPSRAKRLELQGKGLHEQFDKVTYDFELVYLQGVVFLAMVSDESLSHLSDLCRQSRLASDSELESLRRASYTPGNAIASCPIFPELRPILDEAFEIFGEKSEFVVAAPQYCAVAKVVGTLRCTVLKI